MTELGYSRPGGTSVGTPTVIQPQLRTPGAHTPPGRPGCCDPGPVPHMADPRGSLSICTCGLPNCPRVPGAGGPTEGIYPGGLALSGGPMVGGPVDPAVLYSLGGGYGMKECQDVFRGLPHLGGYYPYDAALMYPYMNGYGGIDARRKNATKESTNTLKAWLYEHRKNPYPTKGEKIMLAILTKMTLTQVSTWFANARRRLKKDNKMTWASKDGEDDDDDDDDRDDDDTRRGSGSHSGGQSDTGDDDRCDIDIEDIGNDSDVDECSDHIIARLRNSQELQPTVNNMHLGYCNNSTEFMESSQQTRGQRSPSDVHRLAQPSNHSLGSSTHATDAHPVNTSSPTKQQTEKANSHRTSTESSPSSSRGSGTNIVPITPPPSPREDKSHPSPHSPRHSTATIHHHATVPHPYSLHVPTAGPSPNSHGGNRKSPSQSNETSPKPKIWSIADVMSSKPDRDSVTDSGSARSAHGDRKTSPSPVGRPGSMPPAMGGSPHPGLLARPPRPALGQGGLNPMVLSNPDAYGLAAYYPFGLPHPAAAFMASQRTMSMPGQHPGPMNTGLGQNFHLLAGGSAHPYGAPVRPSTNGFYPRRPMVSSAGPDKDTLRPGEPSFDRKSSDPKVTSCPQTAFKPVAQRQA